MNLMDSQKNNYSEDILYDVELSKELAVCFSEYDYFDLCNAIFCINAWRYNRAHLEFYLSLNYALKICGKGGTKLIKSYGEFCIFFESLKPKLNSVYNDEITPDFGDIKISFDEEFFPVFLGTGHGFVFPIMQSLYALSKSLNIIDSMKNVLLYVKNMVEQLKDTNLYEGPKDIFTLHKPTEAFFNDCRQWYMICDLTLDSKLNFLSCANREKIEETHFILVKEKLYPLFNPSIIIDAFHILYRGVEISQEKQSQIADYVLYQTLCSNFDLNPKSDDLLIQVGVVSDLEKHKIVEEVLFDFLLRNRDKALLFINEDRLKNKNINTLIKIIDDIVSKKQLKLVEFSGTGKCRVWDYSLCDGISIIVYDNHIILENVFNSKVNNLLSLYFFDLITILYRAECVRDVCDFIQSFRKFNWELPLFGGLSALFEAWIKQNKELFPGALDATILIPEPYMVEWDVFEDYVDLNKWYPFTHYEKIFDNPFCWSVVNDDKGYFKTLANNAVLGFGGYYRNVANSYIFFTFNLMFEDINEKYDARHEAIRMIEDINCRNFVLFEDALIKCGLYDFNGVRIMYMPIKYAETVDNTGFLRQNRKYIYSDYTINEGMINSQTSNRFSFQEYKNPTLVCSGNATSSSVGNKKKSRGWDVEHIHARAEDEELINATPDIQKEILSELKEQFLFVGYNDGVDKIDKLMTQCPTGIKPDEFIKEYNKLCDRCGQFNENGLGNLALLDAETNRSYKNALFAVKRKTIIERDKGAVFIPVCTKNVFLKMYSNEVGLKNMQRWDTVDAECYLDEIKRVLIKEARVCQTEVK